jgi:8-oxo-dGTP pyrophosphatase MutT (NUDIX family)
MVREFEEEAGLKIETWKSFCEIKDVNENYIVYFFYDVHDSINDVDSKTDEKLKIINVHNLYFEQVIENLRWLIPMCLDKHHGYSTTFSV